MISPINHSHPVVVVQDKLIVCLILMLQSHSSDKLPNGLVEIHKLTTGLIAIIDQYPGVYTGDTVQHGFSQVHFPLVFPRIGYVLQLLIGVNALLLVVLLVERLTVLTDLLLVHCQDV